MNEPICMDRRECFAQRKVGGITLCLALSRTYRRGEECPFCKRNREITNGQAYPWNKYYAPAHEE